MILTPPFITVIKYGFLGLVVTGAGFLIANTAVTMHYKSVKSEHLAYRVQPRNESLVLDRNAWRCLVQPSRPFCLLSSSKRLQLLKNSHFFNTHADNESRETQPIYRLASDFLNFTSALGVEVTLLEPSILFCMLTTAERYSLISNNLQTSVLLGSLNTLTFGIFQKDSRILSQESSIERAFESGFTFTRIRKWLREVGDFMDTRFLFKRQNMTVTVIVFLQRETFLWHPGLPDEDSLPLSRHLAESRAYENFTTVPFLLEDGKRSGFNLPSGVSHFLIQIQRSKLEECLRPEESNSSSLQTTLSREQLAQRALVAIQELKSILRSHVGTFWIWNKTLAGWNENCNIFQKTPDFQVAVSASVLSRMDLNDTFSRNEYLQLIKLHKWDDYNFGVSLDCFGLIIRISVLYEDHDSAWTYEEDSSAGLKKNYFERIQLCSTSIMGQLVHQPCSS